MRSAACIVCLGGGGPAPRPQRVADDPDGVGAVPTRIPCSQPHFYPAGARDAAGPRDVTVELRRFAVVPTFVLGADPVLRPEEVRLVAGRTVLPDQRDVELGLRQAGAGERQSQQGLLRGVGTDANLCEGSPQGACMPPGSGEGEPARSRQVRARVVSRTGARGTAAPSGERGREYRVERTSASLSTAPRQRTTSSEPRRPPGIAMCTGCPLVRALSSCGSGMPC